MPDPTLQDIMDKLLDIEDEVKDVKHQCNDINPIKSKCDEILSKENVLKLCDSCNDTGKVPRAVDHGEGELGPEIEWVTCPICNGDKKKLFGKLSASEEE